MTNKTSKDYLAEVALGEGNYSKVVVKGNNTKIPTAAQQLGWKTEPSAFGQEFTTILPDSNPLDKDAIDKFIADLGLAFSSGDWAKKESYSPGDENEPDMVSNCCGAAIADVYDGVGRCTDCQEMAEAVPEDENESDELARLKTLSNVFEETYDGDDFYEAYGDLWFNEDDIVDEAEYQGRKVKLGKPMRGDVKKFKVYVKDPKTGNVKKVNFGDPNMKIKKSNPARRRSFRARHNCDNPGPRTKARYWSCRKW